jgi:hypothetical protein
MNFDIFFISYNESNQEKNWKRIIDLHPAAIRLHGIAGIDKVHLLANEIANSDYFWTVDGDNWIIEPLEWGADIAADLLMFRAIDPITKELTTLGGVKLWRKNSIVNQNMNKGDFCLNATANKLVIDTAFSYTVYNESPYDAWKTSFRHCVKLLSSIFKSRPYATNIDKYIEHWKKCEHLDDGKNCASWAYCGYLDALEYVKLYDHDHNQLFMINNYSWLKNYFNLKYKEKL